MDSPALESALKYASFGFHVFPLNGKTPAIPKERGGKGVLDATRDEETIRNWWTEYPDAAVGIACGASGIVVVDVDPRNGGNDSAQRLQSDLGLRLAEATGLVVRTGGGGWHFYFKAPAEAIKGGSHKLGPGIDLQAGNKYVVAPGSNGYEFIQQGKMAALPDLILERVKVHQEEVRALTDDKTVIRDGEGRHRFLVSTAGKLRSQGFSADEIYMLLSQVNKNRILPPKDDRQIRQIAESVGKNYRPDQQIGKSIHRIKPQPIHLVKDEKFEWLFMPYMARKTLTICQGLPGDGKTSVMVAWAAELTRQGHNVLFCTAEDSLGATLKPRFLANAGVPERFYATDELFTLAEPQTLADALEQTRASMVVIDPIQAYMGAGTDMYRANAVRAVLSPLVGIANRYNAGIVLIAHEGKDQSQKLMLRSVGSIDFSGAARNVLSIKKDPQNTKRRLLIHAKTNLYRLGPTLIFQTDDNDKIEWLGESPITAETYKEKSDKDEDDYR